MPRISRATISVMTAIRIRLIQLAESQASIKITSFEWGGSAVRKEVNLTAPSIKREGGLRDFLFYRQLLCFQLFKPYKEAQKLTVK